MYDDSWETENSDAHTRSVTSQEVNNYLRNQGDWYMQTDSNPNSFREKQNKYLPTLDNEAIKIP